MRIGTILIVTVLLILLGASAWFAYDGLTVGIDTPVSNHAYIAMGLGIFFSILIGAGLMALVFTAAGAVTTEPPHVVDDGEDTSK